MASLVVIMAEVVEVEYWWSWRHDGYRRRNNDDDYKINRYDDDGRGYNNN